MGPILAISGNFVSVLAQCRGTAWKTATPSWHGTEDGTGKVSTGRRTQQEVGFPSSICFRYRCLGHVCPNKRGTTQGIRSRNLDRDLCGGRRQTLRHRHGSLDGGAAEASEPSAGLRRRNPGPIPLSPIPPVTMTLERQRRKVCVNNEGSAPGSCGDKRRMFR